MARAPAPKGTAGPMPGPKHPQADEQPVSEWKENLVALLFVALLVAIFVWFAMNGFSRRDGDVGDTTHFRVTFADDPLLGSSDAPHTIILFTSYGCSACDAWWRETFPELKEAYLDTGKALFAVRDYPLRDTAAAIAAECAYRQERFWEYHALLLGHPISEELLLSAAESVELDRDDFAACRSSSEARQAVERDAREAVAQGGVSGTPTFFVDGTKLVGNHPLASFATLLDGNDYK